MITTTTQAMDTQNNIRQRHRMKVLLTSKLGKQHVAKQKCSSRLGKQHVAKKNVHLGLHTWMRNESIYLHKLDSFGVQLIKMVWNAWMGQGVWCSELSVTTTVILDRWWLWCIIMGRWWQDEYYYCDGATSIQQLQLQSIINLGWLRNITSWYTIYRINTIIKVLPPR